MANRAQRRADAKKARRGIPSQYDQTRGRGRANMLDEYALQEKSRRIAEGKDVTGPWKPTGGYKETVPEATAATKFSYENPTVAKTPMSVNKVFRILNWALIVIAAIAFLVVMWFPNVPMWLIITVSVVFALGVLSLFFTNGNSAGRNPNLDENGTAV